MSFSRIEEVEQYAAANGGEQGVRIAIATRLITDIGSVGLANEWLHSRMQAAKDAERQQAIDVAIKSAKASKNSAFWTMIAA